MFLPDEPGKKKQTVNRKFYLELLHPAGALRNRQNIAVLGGKKAGKTLALSMCIGSLKQEEEVMPAYIDLSRISTTPEKFSIELIGNVCFWSLGSSVKFYKKFMELDFLLEKKELKEFSEFFKTIKNELQKIKPDQSLIIKTAFDFIDALAKKKKICLVLDNFENVFCMNNFKQIKNILSFFRFDSKNVSYIVASSNIHLIKNSLKNFRIVELKNLGFDETRELAETILGKTSTRVVDEIYNYSNGNPYLIKLLCEKYKEIKDVKMAFLTELLAEDAPIYNYCKDVLDENLNRARGDALLMLILKVLAEKKEATLTEISRAIYRSAPVTKSLLERLIPVDLIEKKDSKFSIIDPVLRRWISFVFNGYENVSDKKILEELSKEI